MKTKTSFFAPLIGLLFLCSCSATDSSIEQNPHVSSASTTEVSPVSAVEPVIESAFKGNQLTNGKSPLDPCFGKGKYAGKAWVEFKNDYGSDAIVCLVNVNSGKVIRNEYIQSGSNFKMSKIPAGTYYLKVYKGNDWNPTKQNICGTLGAFDTDAEFSASDSPSDYIQIDNSARSYTTGSITLYTVSNGNMASEPISEETFFNN